jgi:hypothetical protein
MSRNCGKGARSCASRGLAVIIISDNFFDKGWRETDFRRIVMEINTQALDTQTSSQARRQTRCTSRYMFLSD